MNSLNKGRLSGLTTIEDVKKSYLELYDKSNILGKVELKGWLRHSISREANGNKPFKFNIYNRHMTISEYIIQIELDVLDVSDIGSKEDVITSLLKD